MHATIPFGLMNVGATFQRAMNIDFAEEKYRFVVIYMDDITLYSKSDRDHIKQLLNYCNFEIYSKMYCIPPSGDEFGLVRVIERINVNLQM